MSYYQFSGPIQGGFGPDDEEMRRRRRHHNMPQYADVNFSMGGSEDFIGPGNRPRPPSAAYTVPREDATMQDVGPQAPRQAAAVDMGDGPVQPNVGQKGDLERAAFDFDESMPDIPDDAPVDPQGRRAVPRPVAPPPVQRAEVVDTIMGDERIPSTAATVLKEEQPKKAFPFGGSEDFIGPRPAAPRRGGKEVRFTIPPPSGPGKTIGKKTKESQRVVLPRVVLRGNTRDQAQDEHRRVLDQLNRRNRDMIDLMGQSRAQRMQSQQEKDALIGQARQGFQQAAAQRAQIIGQGRQHIQDIGSRAVAQGLRHDEMMQQERNARRAEYADRDWEAHDIREDAADAATQADAQLRRQQEASGEALRVGGARVASLQDQVRRQEEASGEAERVAGARGRSQTEQLKREKLRAADAANQAEQMQGSMLEQLRKQREDSGEAERVAGAKGRSQQDKITGLQQRIGSLTAEGNALLKKAGENVINLLDKIDQGDATAASLRDALKRAEDELAAARRAAALRKPSPGNRQLYKVIKHMSRDLEEAKKEMRKPAPAAPRAPAAAPIVVQGGAGGGGASSSAGGSSAASGGGAARAPDLSGLVEAVKKIAASKGDGAAAKGGTTKGITQARRTYTDKRKVKLAEMRALKSKRIREFNTKTKKMPKAARNKARREYKKKVNAQFREMQSQFPTARGLSSVGVIRDLIRKISALRTAK